MRMFLLLFICFTLSLYSDEGALPDEVKPTDDLVEEASLAKEEEENADESPTLVMLPKGVLNQNVSPPKEENKVVAEQPLLAARQIEFENKVEEEEMEALRKWIRNKRLVTVKEIGGDLSLSGEVRVEFQDNNEKRNGIRQRGSGPPNSATNKPSRVYDVEVNLMLDYRTDRSWASIKLEFDNDMGLISGTMNKITLERAYLGGRFIDEDTFTLDGEIGRRFLGNIFSSKVEFGGLFDGLLLRLSKAYETIGDLYLNTGIFLVDDKTNHYGYVAELGLLGIYKTGLQAKYAIIDWMKHRNDDVSNLRGFQYQFIVSQASLAYVISPTCFSWTKVIKPYAAVLLNHVAVPNALTGNSEDDGKVILNGNKANWAWYAGVSIGQVLKQGDWALDANYQWVQAQAIPSYDVSGIGRGNAANVGFYTVDLNGTGKNNTLENAVGSTNYKGVRIEFLYALTDNITLLESFQASNTLDLQIGPNLKYKQFEIELIYAF